MSLAIDTALAEQFGGDAFVTAVIARLGLDSGVLEWIDAGHPAPLLLRNRRVVRQLEAEKALPFGLGGDRPNAATEQLQPGDRVLFFTDGLLEGRSPEGEDFGIDRLIDHWERDAESGQPAEETLRRLTRGAIEFCGGKLRDDATLLHLAWHPGEEAAS